MEKVTIRIENDRNFSEREFTKTDLNVIILALSSMEDTKLNNVTEEDLENAEVVSEFLDIMWCNIFK